MSFAAYIPLSGFVINVFFALFVFSRAPRVLANRVYLLLGLSIATWNLGSFFLFIVPESDHDSALFWARFLQFGCIFGVAAFFHLALIIAHFRVGRWIWALYGLQVALAASNFTPLFVSDVRWLGTSGWYSKAGPAFHIFNLPFMLMFGSIFVLLKRARSLPREQRGKLYPMIFTETLLSVGGANDVMPIVGSSTIHGPKFRYIRGAVSLRFSTEPSSPTRSCKTNCSARESPSAECSPI